MSCEATRVSERRLTPLESLVKVTVELQGFRAPMEWTKSDKYVDQLVGSAEIARETRWRRFRGVLLNPVCILFFRLLPGLHWATRSPEPQYALAV